MSTLYPLLHAIPEWLQFIFLALCSGISLYRIFLRQNRAQGEGPPQSKSGGRRNGRACASGALDTRLWLIYGASAGLALVASVMELVVRCAEMSALPLSAVPSILPVVLLCTHLGNVWLIRLAALLILLSALKAQARYRESRPFDFILFFLVLIIAMTMSASGHAADSGDFTVKEMVDWLHLSATLMWGGGLLLLSTILLPCLTGPDAAPDELAAVAGRFSQVAGIAVAAVAVTGAYNGYSLVGTVSALREAPYGWIVTVKIVLFVAVVGLGAVNRYFLLPRLRVPNEGGAGPSLNELRFVRSVRAEAGLILIILLCAALLRHQVPAAHYLHMQNASPSSPHEHQHENGSRP